MTSKRQPARSKTPSAQSLISVESIFNEMNEVVWSASLPEFRLLYATPSIQKLTGRPAENLVGKTDWWQSILHPSELESIAEISHQLKSKGRFTSRNRIIRPNGSHLRVHMSGKVVFNEANEPIRVDGVMVDRTHHHEAETALINEVRFQKVLIDISTTYINLDTDQLDAAIQNSLNDLGSFVNADRAYVFQYDFKANTTSNTHEWCREGIEPEINNLQDVPIEAIPFWLEKHKKGEPLYVPDVSRLPNSGDYSLRAILEPQGIKSLITLPMLDGNELLGFVGFDYVNDYYEYSERERKLLFVFVQMLINIRKRQLNERIIAEQESKFTNLIDTMNLGLIEVDAEGRIAYVNSGFLQLSGWKQHELAGKRFKSLEKKVTISVPVSGAQHLAEEASGDTEWLVETVQGKPRWWYVSESPRSDAGKVLVFLDITLQKELELELEKARDAAESAGKAKELFLANMSHEIRTPLNVVIGMVRELMKERLNTHQRSIVQQAASAAKHLLTILNNVLDVSKIESGELVIDHRDFNLESVANNVKSILNAEAEEKNLDFQIVVDKALAQAHIGDDIRLRQVLINLVGNAIKFTDEGKVWLTILKLKNLGDHELIRFEVEDTGVGMSEDFIQRIFDKFSQEQSTANRRFEGTGLGMSIANDLVGLMGGELRVQSQKHKGTRCTFELLLPHGDVSRIAGNAVSVHQGDLDGMKLLLVEDNEMNRFIASQSLLLFGCEVDEATNGKEAIDRLSERTYDLVLMDIQMPVMDGVEATRIIREELQLELPIVALTANAFKHDIQRYLDSGFNDYVIKPYEEEELLRKIARYNSSAQSKLNGTLDAVQLYNLQALQTLSRGNEEFVDRMTSIFIELAENSVNALRISRRQTNYHDLRAAAHKLKPSLQQMGIDALYHVIRDIEQFNPHQTPLDVLDKNLERIYTVLSRVVSELKNEKRGH